ncbi:MAG: GNAT family N-acetyltransferase [Ruminococcaceae bacterium]|nr:GNAT family N-acetyltransferase [Oscillospiraceae bacterium]
MEKYYKTAPASLNTKRLVLRRWEESDAEDLYICASDPDVGPAAGWKPHKSVKESLEIIRNVFSGPEAYAVCLKEDGKPIGAIELMLGGSSVNNLKSNDECELGYWIAKPFWGQGLIPEAAKEMLRRAFEDLNMSKVWCGHYDGNEKSKRVQEKVGFKYQYTKDDVFVPAFNETRTEHMSCITKEEWKNELQNN